MPAFNEAEEMALCTQCSPQWHPRTVPCGHAAGCGPGFVNGSKVQFTIQEEQNLANVITAVYSNRVTYKQLYCQLPEMKNWKNGVKPSPVKTLPLKRIEQLQYPFTIERVNMGYKEGYLLPNWRSSLRHLCAAGPGYVRLHQPSAAGQKICPQD